MNQDRKEVLGGFAAAAVGNLLVVFAIFIFGFGQWVGQ